LKKCENTTNDYNSINLRRCGLFYAIRHDCGIGGDVFASDEEGAMKLKLSFFVPGIASPSGSKKAFMHPKTGRIIVMDTAKRKTSWQSIVSLHAQQAMTDAGAKLTNEAVAMTIDFYFLGPNAILGAVRMRPGSKRPPRNITSRNPT
jgi:hypothetical protein